jgi:hypothetical protein
MSYPSGVQEPLYVVGGDGSHVAYYGDDDDD